MDKDCNRTELAEKLFKEGYNCCQAVVLAYADCFELDKDTAVRLCAGFGGGMGRLREVCGAFSGAVLLAGMKMPFNVEDYEAKKAVYQIVQDMAKDFKKINGSIVCRELLDLTKKADDPAPSQRTQEYYKKRPCAEIVRTAAEIVEAHLLFGKTDEGTKLVDPLLNID